jgi:AcrR family transcriptional regulator
MYEDPYELGSAADGYPLRIRARGRSVLSNPMINRGTAFTPAERRALGLIGLLPSGVSTLEGQRRRVYAQYQRQPDDLAKNVFLANMRDRNEVLFYRLLTEHLDEMLPIVYTPTVGKAIERYSLGGIDIAIGKLAVQSHRQEVRQAILDAVGQLVEQQGVLAVTMSEVAERAGIGRATLYKYFPDVQTLLAAWHQQHVLSQLQVLTALRDQGGSPEHRLRAVLEAYARSANAEPATRQPAWRAAAPGPGDRPCPASVAGGCPRAHRPDGDLTERSVSHSTVYCIFHEAEFRIHITKVTP